ncbi:MAG: glycosyltransferase family 2 protein [Solirubrobacterales bacterium]|nr:glycosyltransferase family 2 protein [Solirubrobacterales bacterium]
MTRSMQGSEETRRRLPEIGAPVISVVVCSYNSRRRIDRALISLRAQDIDEPYEVIVVDSGGDDAADYVRVAYPEARVIRSNRRLWPGPARNAGVRAASGQFVAFLPDDGVAKPDWLRRRVAMHREGFAAVGGSITNGTPLHPVGLAGYFLEYSALIPSDQVLAEQEIPHCLSYDRLLFERLGTFPEETETGEDTLFNERLLAAKVKLGFDSRVQLDHLNLRRLVPYLRHQYEHGRGLAKCVVQFGLASPIGPAEQGGITAAWRMFAFYPIRRWWNVLRRIARGRRRWVPVYVAVSPLVWAGLWATSLGAWREWRRLRRGP